MNLRNREYDDVQLQRIVSKVSSTHKSINRGNYHGDRHNNSFDMRGRQNSQNPLISNLSNYNIQENNVRNSQGNQMNMQLRLDLIHQNSQQNIPNDPNNNIEIVSYNVQ